MRLRVAPELDFQIDDSIERGARLSTLIHDAVESDRQPSRRTRTGHGMNDARRWHGESAPARQAGGLELERGPAARPARLPSAQGRPHGKPRPARQRPPADLPSARPPRRAASCSMPTRPICFASCLAAARRLETVKATRSRRQPCRSSTKRPCAGARPASSGNPSKCRRCTRRSSRTASASIASRAPASKSSAPRVPCGISRLELIGLGPDWVEFEVACSKGTYVRSLAEDLARALRHSRPVLAPTPSEHSVHSSSRAMHTLESDRTGCGQRFRTLGAMLLADRRGACRGCLRCSSGLRSRLQSCRDGDVLAVGSGRLARENVRRSVGSSWVPAE